MQTETFRLKLAKKHPRDFFRILDIVVDGYQYKNYELNEAQFKELESVGAKHWVKCEERDEESVDTNGEGFEDLEPLTDEEKKVLEDAFDLKANSENQNDPTQVEGYDPGKQDPSIVDVNAGEVFNDPAPVEPSAELPKNDEPAEDKPKKKKH